MNNDVMQTARCAGCGYMLRGLDGRFCPECGRAFDPDDNTTFLSGPARSVYRKWIARGIVTLVLLAVIVAFCPRGILRSQMVFACRKCGQTTTVTRYELKPPGYLQWRYPGFSRTVVTESPKDADKPKFVCMQHDYSFKVRLEWRDGLVTGNLSQAVAGGFYVNGYVVDPTNAAAVMEKVTGNSAVGVVLGGTGP